MSTPPPPGYEGIPPHGHIPTPRHTIVGPDGKERLGLATDREAERAIRGASEQPHNTIVGPDGKERLATDWEASEAMREWNAQRRNTIVGADGKIRSATDEEVRQAIRQAASERPGLGQGGPAAAGASDPRLPHGEGPLTGGSGAYPPQAGGPGGRPFGMRPQDQEVFAEAARQQGRWIIVRETNPEALKYVGEPGYVPKPFECKAKSANMPGHEYAGLVVNPRVHPEAFRNPAAAAKEWDKVMEHRPAGFTEDVQGRLRINGKLVHSDYDVYDVIDPNRPRGNLGVVKYDERGQLIVETHGLPKIKDFVNKGVGSDVIQHSGEAQFKGHSEQRLIVFGPDGQRFVTDGKQAIEKRLQTAF